VACTESHTVADARPPHRGPMRGGGSCPSDHGAARSASCTAILAHVEMREMSFWTVMGSCMWISTWQPLSFSRPSRSCRRCNSSSNDGRLTIEASGRHEMTQSPPNSSG